MTTPTIQFAPKEMMARKNLDLRAGDTVRVHLKIQERGKTRIQMFEGLVLARKHGAEAGATFTVRKITNGVGVERVFPLYSPMIDKIEIVRRSRVRQSKLYFLRTKVARDIRRKMRNLVDYTATTEDLEIPAEAMLDETPEESAVDATQESAEVTEKPEPATEEPVKEEAAEEVAKVKAEEGVSDVDSPEPDSDSNDAQQQEAKEDTEGK